MSHPLTLGSTYRRLSLPLLLSFAALLGGCQTQRMGNAPVEDRGTMAGRPNPGHNTAPNPTMASTTSANTGTSSTAAIKPVPGIENAGKPGYYAIRPGDTLIRIGLETGQSWRDIARWNNLDNPNIIEVGQIVRIIPPGTVVSATSAPITVTSAPSNDGVVTRPVSIPGAATPTSVPAGTGTRSSPTPASPSSSPSPTPSPTPAPVATAPMPPASSPSDEEIAWIWPVAGANAGSVVTRFDEATNKGIGISGKMGDPVLAAADGRVVYAGAGLRGYGNLVILKHNNTYLTAYAHNQTLLVKEDQSVRKGQKIAEMGNSDSDRVKLHFEIRRQGKPTDPLRLLPK